MIVCAGYTAEGHKLMVVNNATITPNPMVPEKTVEIDLDVELCKQPLTTTHKHTHTHMHAHTHAHTCTHTHTHTCTHNTSSQKHFYCYPAVETITSGSVIASISILVNNKVHPIYPPGTPIPLCKLLRQINKKCPLQKGQQKLTITTQIPTPVPPVSMSHYTSKLTTHSPSLVDCRECIY